MPQINKEGFQHENLPDCRKTRSTTRTNVIYKVLIKVIFYLTKRQCSGFHRENRYITCFLRIWTLPYLCTPTNSNSQNITSFFKVCSACRLYRHAETADKVYVSCLYDCIYYYTVIIFLWIHIYPSLIKISQTTDVKFQVQYMKQEWNLLPQRLFPI